MYHVPSSYLQNKWEILMIIIIKANINISGYYVPDMVLSAL